MNILRSILATTVGLLVGFNAVAEYPEKPIRLLVPFPAGGTADQAARILAEPLSKALGQAVIVEAHPGADSQTGTAEAARAAPDGYTLLAGSLTGLNYVPAVRKSPPYDPTRDFTLITKLYDTAFMLFVHPSLPVKSVGELLEYIRANPGKLSYGTGTATAILASSELMAAAKAPMVHVPYKGDIQGFPDLLTGRIQVMFAVQGIAMQYASEGKLRVLATTLAKRTPLFPEVPTLQEVGLPPLSVKTWNGLVGPAGMPKAVAERLSREVNAILARPEVRIQLEKVGFLANGSTPDELAALVKEQLEVWKRAVREGKLSQE